jgi:uncharacterized repeat protein (TIGR03803 family)
VQGSDGNFYGMTTGGEPPSGSSGTIFQISTNGALTTLHSNYLTSFAAINLVQGSDGYFYGTTSGGIFAGSGYVFKFSLNGALTILYIFGGGNDGADPNGLVQGSDGYFYGTTTFGGTNSDGTVFKIGPTGALTSLYSFGSVQDTNGVPLDGANPFAAPIIGTFGCLVQGNDGYFYGTTGGGGTNGAGTVFRISTNGALTSLYSFKGTNDGAGPNGLVQGTDGSFYGTTEFGGATNYDAGWERYGYGTVFRLSIVPEPPQLTIVPSGLYVILTWPTNYAGFSYAGYVLQSTTNLGSSALWNPVSTSPVIIGGQKVVINPISGTQQFFRLSQ